VTFEVALIMGLGLGLRHATDADHLVAVGSLLDGRRTTSAAVRTAALWGAGHTASFVGVGLVLAFAGIELPPKFEVATDALVALMLIAFGLTQLLAVSRGLAPTIAPSRPVMIGFVHGLAGSAGLGLVCAGTIGSLTSALGYLAMFGLGTLCGMVGLTYVLTFPLSRAAGRERTWTAIRFSSSVASVLLGLFLAHHLLAAHLR
jgi:hypothetical protein